jgi:hypothetical protein
MRELAPGGVGVGTLGICGIDAMLGAPLKFIVALVKSIGGGASCGLNGVLGGARGSLKLIGDAKDSAGSCTLPAGNGDSASFSCGGEDCAGGHVTPPTDTSGAACSTGV